MTDSQKLAIVLRLLKDARDYRMDMAAYERIQQAINILQP